MNNSISARAYNTFTHKQKEVWNLVMKSFYTQREAAKMLGITREALQDRLRKAKKRFRAFIREVKNES